MAGRLQCEGNVGVGKGRQDADGGGGSRSHSALISEVRLRVELMRHAQCKSPFSYLHQVITTMMMTMATLRHCHRCASRQPPYVTAAPASNYLRRIITPRTGATGVVGCNGSGVERIDFKSCIARKRQPRPEAPQIGLLLGLRPAITKSLTVNIEAKQLVCKRIAGREHDLK